MVAYSPTLLLVESNVYSYKIYTLKDPRNNSVFYVGQTCQALQERLNGHINETGANRDKINFIKEIIESGMKPIIEEVETIHTRCYIDRVLVSEREFYWIKHYRGIGCKLFNIANPSRSEYEGYLACIKRGETKWHYYYCGKTAGGLEVYDERKMIADGFRFPERVVPKDYCYEPIKIEYNPWQNERFKKKVGYLKSKDDRMSYVPCYNDENPDFYDEDY